MNSNTIEKLALTEEIHNIFIRHNMSDEVFDLMEETILTTQHNRKKGLKGSATNNICLIGETGAGKTKLSSRLLRKFPSQKIIQNNYEINKIPTFYASLQSHSINGLAIILLNQLGDPDSNKRATQIELTVKLSKQLETAETSLVMLDEFHEILSKKDSGLVMSWLKSLTNATRTPVMIMGTPNLKSLIESNAEVKRRFRIVELKPLDFTITDPDNAFTNFVQPLASGYQKLLSLKSFPKFDSMADLIRLNLATNGYPGNISELFKSAAKLAIREGVNDVTLHHFRDAYMHDRCTNLKIRGLNPFQLREDQLLDVFNNKSTRKKKS